MSLDDIAAETVASIRSNYFEKLNKLKRRELDAKDMVRTYAAERDFARQEQRRVEDINHWLVAEIDYLKQELEELQYQMFDNSSSKEYPTMKDYFGEWRY